MFDCLCKSRHVPTSNCVYRGPRLTAYEVDSGFVEFLTQRATFVPCQIGSKPCHFTVVDFNGVVTKVSNLNLTTVNYVEYDGACIKIF
jgi:hypothetical protein